MSAYFDGLCDAMRMLAREPHSIFMGQAVACEGTAMFKTLAGVPTAQRVELPVAEDMQMGMAIGMSLAGLLPICIYPRWNFLLLATNQLVLHLDKLPLYSRYQPRVIIRTAVATDDPLDPGPQHLGDFSGAFRKILSTIDIFEMKDSRAIIPSYRMALQSKASSVMVEYTRQY